MGWGQGRYGWGTFGSDIPQFGVTDIEVLDSVLLSVLETGIGQWVPSEPDALLLNPVLDSVYGKGTPPPGYHGAAASFLNASLGPDQFAECTVAAYLPGALGNNNSIGPAVRGRIDPSTGLIFCYAMEIRYDGGYQFIWEVNVPPGQIFSAATDGILRDNLVPPRFDLPFGAGNTMRIEAVGSSIVGKLNGAIVFGPVTDTRLLDGQIGIEVYPENVPDFDIQVSNFRGGALPSGAILTPPLTTIGDVTGQLSSMWSRDQIIQYLNDRQRRFINESGITAAVMYQAGQAEQPRYSLPDNLVDIRRVAWANSADPMAYTELPRADGWELDHGRTNWPSASAQSPEVYLEDHLPSLTIAVEPAPTDVGEMELIAVTQGTQVDGSGVLLSVPDDFTPYLAWGVRADMLAGEFEGNDPVRAAHCESRFAEGIELARILVSGDGGQ